MNGFLSVCVCRKLLEGEETRIGTGVTYSAPSITSGGMQNYGYQSHFYTSSSKASKKESKDEEPPQKSATKVSHREVYEETAVTKKAEKPQEAGGVPTNQKN